MKTKVNDLTDEQLDERPAMREGYCCDCSINTGEFSVIEASRAAGHLCYECWMTDEKPNWRSKNNKPYFACDGTLMNANGTRSILDDIDD